TGTFRGRPQDDRMPPALADGESILAVRQGRLDDDQRTAAPVNDFVQCAVDTLIIQNNGLRSDGAHAELRKSLAAAFAHVRIPFLVKPRALAPEDQNSYRSIQRCLLRLHLYLAPISQTALPSSVMCCSSGPTSGRT